MRRRLHLLFAALLVLCGLLATDVMARGLSQSGVYRILEELGLIGSDGTPSSGSPTFDYLNLGDATGASQSGDLYAGGSGGSQQLNYQPDQDSNNGTLALSNNSGGNQVLIGGTGYWRLGTLGDATTLASFSAGLIGDNGVTYTQTDGTLTFDDDSGTDAITIDSTNSEIAILLYDQCAGLGEEDENEFNGRGLFQKGRTLSGTTGSGTTSILENTDLRRGWGSLETGTTSGSTASMNIGGTIATDGDFRVRFKIRVGHTTVAISSMNVEIGLNGDGFADEFKIAATYEAASDTNWQLTTDAGPTETPTDTDTGVAVAADTNYTITIDFDQAPTPTATMTINGTTVSTTSDLPAGTDDLQIYLSVENTAAVARDVVIDYWRILWEDRD